MTALIERIVSDLKTELAHTTVLTKAYFILPRDWRTRNREQCIEAMRSLEGTYRLIAVYPDEDNCGTVPYEAGFTAAVGRGEVIFPDEDFITVFPVPSRNLVIKAALCLEDDFETKWIAECIARGRAVYMRKEATLFTGMEPEAYKKRVQSYYRDAEAFGIQFETVSKKRKIITADDIDKLRPGKELRLYRGDIVTALAAEHADTLGISILYQ